MTVRAETHAPAFVSPLQARQHAATRARTDLCIAQLASGRLAAAHMSATSLAEETASASSSGPRSGEVDLPRGVKFSWRCPLCQRNRISPNLCPTKRHDCKFLPFVKALKEDSLCSSCHNYARGCCKVDMYALGFGSAEFDGITLGPSRDVFLLISALPAGTPG